jgi:hypothetical protein
MSPAPPDRSPTDHLTGGCASGRYRVKDDVTAEAVSVWHLGRDHFAACNGTVPVEVSSGEKKVCRLSGDNNEKWSRSARPAAADPDPA